MGCGGVSLSVFGADVAVVGGGGGSVPVVAGLVILDEGEGVVVGGGGGSLSVVEAGVVEVGDEGIALPLLEQVL